MASQLKPKQKRKVLPVHVRVLLGDSISRTGGRREEGGGEREGGREGLHACGFWMSYLHIPLCVCVTIVRGICLHST